MVLPVVDKTPALRDVLYRGQLYRDSSGVKFILGSICSIGRGYKGEHTVQCKHVEL